MKVLSQKCATDGPPATEKEARGQKGLVDQEGDILVQVTFARGLGSV